MKQSIFVCRCNAEKTKRLILDGGVCGIYELDLCRVCDSKQDKKFLISEEDLK